ncbi:uncharacterized protein DUF4328 [Streptomyces sp. KhCrAH-43]|uniref:DUF4328 domain-containing protein n=1 Tax=Streptomyces TaxID=1883 RepID=UPI000374AA0F|nr:MULTISPECIES: DUF4328 domain-containing protein [unclassified Streptomyces]MYS38394.1 DUF4328 domain-containing protein [Streptomyces sp. SID4920]MYX66586.1 DUF4328 domain-containing protein [Streptomyces sp. SID8373]RAJ68079.1 uncharacterized protein DUF4328 [Streptomyces sp. KhCrAH-43]
MPTPARLDHLHSPVGLAKAVCVLLGVVAFADVLGVAAGIHARVLLADGLDDGFLAVDEEAWDRADMLYRAAGGLQALTFLACVVVFIVWFRRVRLNAEVFDPRAHSMAPGWAVGAWFVPVGNFWLPYRVASGVWTASAPADTPGGRSAAPRGLLNGWWAVFVAAEILSRAGGEAYDRAEAGEKIIDGLDMVAFGDALEVGAAVLAILFVRRLTAMQTLRAMTGALPIARGH